MTNLNVSNLIQCCGLREMSSVSYFEGDPEGAMESFARKAYPHETNQPCNVSQNGYHSHTAEWTGHFAHVVFSQAGKPNSSPYFKNRYGVDFATLITKEKLGNLVESDWQINPNSTRPLKVWIFTPDKQAILKWWQARQPTKAEKEETPVVSKPKRTRQMLQKVGLMAPPPVVATVGTEVKDGPRL